MSQYETSRCFFHFSFFRYATLLHHLLSIKSGLAFVACATHTSSCLLLLWWFSSEFPPFPSRSAQKGGRTDGATASAAECSLLKEIAKLHNVPRVGGTIFIMARHYDNLRWKIDCNCFSRISDGLSSPLLALFLAIDGDSFCFGRLSRGERASPQSFTIMSTKDALIFDG